MKTFVKNLLIFVLLINVSYCSNKKRSPFLIPLGQVVQQEANLPNISTPTPTQASPSNPTNTNDGTPSPPSALPDLSFNSSSSSVFRSWDNDTTHSILLNLSSSSSSVVTASITTSGTAVAGTHFLLSSSTVTFNPNETSKTFGVTIKQEDCVDYSNPYSLILTLTSPTNANLGTQNSHTITITRNAGCE